MLVPRASNSCAALTRSALCAWVDRAMRHDHITLCDANQAQIRNANPRWSAQSGSYLLRSGSGEPAARQHLHEPIPEALASNRTWRSIPCPCRLLCRRLRHPQPRLCGGGPGVDEGGDDQARADAQRGQDLAEGRPSGALHVPWLLVRSALVQGEWPMVPGHKPVQEERATAQDNSGQPAGARQQRPMAGSARHAKQISARLVELFLLRDAPVRIPQCRPLYLRARARLPRKTAQSGRARHPPVLLRRCLWGTRSAAPRTPATRCRVVCLAVKPVGEPDSGNRDLRFDERRWETG